MMRMCREFENEGAGRLCSGVRKMNEILQRTKI
jgi:hypothetical protein